MAISNKAVSFRIDGDIIYLSIASQEIPFEKAMISERIASTDMPSDPQFILLMSQLLKDVDLSDNTAVLAALPSSFLV